MATPSPADTPPPAGVQPPAKVEHRDARADFIPPSALEGRHGDGSGSISRLGIADQASVLRLDGTEPGYASYRPSTVPGSGLADAVVLLGIILGVLGYLIWRHFQKEAQENFAGQGHNKD